MCGYRGHCAKKDSCYFAHHENERRSGFCLQYFNTGYCRFDDCRFQHCSSLPQVPGWLRQSYDDICKKRHSRSFSRSRSPSPQRYRRRSPSPDRRVEEMQKEMAGMRHMISALQKDLAEVTQSNSKLVTCMIMFLQAQNAIKYQQNQQQQQQQQQQHQPQHQPVDYIGSLLAIAKAQAGQQ